MSKTVLKIILNAIKVLKYNYANTLKNCNIIYTRDYNIFKNSIVTQKKSLKIFQRKRYNTFIY